MTASKIYVSAFARTPFGKFGGALRTLDLPRLGTVAVKEAIRRSGLKEDQIDETAIGVNFPGANRSIARQVMLQAGIPDNRVAYTIDRACCSSLAAVTLASRGLLLGETAAAVAGGVENLSKVPYFLEDVRFGPRFGHISMQDQLVVSCPHTGVPRAVQAGLEAGLYGINRQEQDEWALRSQARYAAAKKAGMFDNEIVEVKIHDQFGKLITLYEDEVPRPDSSLEKLLALPTIYGSTTITAGNAPDLSSGASALVLTTAQAQTAHRLATLEGWAMASGDPQQIASIPARAAQLALKRAGLTLKDIDLFEINEAFAAVPLVSTLVLAEGDPKLTNRLRARTNVHGGAVAIGHPTGATAARLIMHLIVALQHRGGGLGVAAICGGIGEGEAVIVKVGD